MVLALATILLAACSEANLWVFATEVDFTGNIPATDRFYYYDLNQDPPVGGGQYPALEWYSASPGFSLDRVVYRRGNNIVVRTRFFNSNPIPVVASFQVRDAELVVPPGYNRPSTIVLELGEPADQAVYIPGQGTTDVTFTITGVPNFVALGRLEYDSHMIGLQQPYLGADLISDPVGSTGPEGSKLYLVDESPVNLQEVPWTDVLDYSCNFGYGKAGPSAVAKELTLGLFWSSVFAYNLGTPGVPSMWMTDDLSAFMLQKLLDELAESGIQSGNCVDVSAFLSILAESQGIDGVLQQLVAADGSDFITNQIVPIGSDAGQLGLYIRLAFSMHNQFKWSSGTYDAALAYRYNLSAADHRKPADGWPMPGYWQTLLNDSAYGLVYRDIIPSDNLNGTHPDYPFYVVVPDASVGPRQVDPSSAFWEFQDYIYVAP